MFISIKHPNFKMEKYTIWPLNKIRLQNFLRFPLNLPTYSIVEKKLKSMFPSGIPVLFSSGRAAINITLIYQNQKRLDLIGVNKFTSHCVLDSISRIATPIRWDSKDLNIKKRIVYHQWGYYQNENFLIETIDDSVDTLCDIGTKLFPSSKNFEIWSLPKILGTSSGAILWCKNDKIAKEIKRIRNLRGGGLFCWILRVLGLINKNFYWLWQGIEVQKGNLSKIELFEISNAIQQWDLIVKDRKKKLDLLWQFAPEWLNKPIDRLPCVIPLEFNIYKDNYNLQKLGINIRHFEKINNKKIDFVKVFPLPIHQDISIESLIKIKEFLE